MDLEKTKKEEEERNTEMDFSPSVALEGHTVMCTSTMIKVTYNKPVSESPKPYVLKLDYFAIPRGPTRRYPLSPPPRHNVERALPENRVGIIVSKETPYKTNVDYQPQRVSIPLMTYTPVSPAYEAVAVAELEQQLNYDNSSDPSISHADDDYDNDDDDDGNGNVSSDDLNHPQDVPIPPDPIPQTPVIPVIPVIQQVQQAGDVSENLSDLSENIRKGARKRKSRSEILLDQAIGIEEVTKEKGKSKRGALSQPTEVPSKQKKKKRSRRDSIALEAPTSEEDLSLTASEKSSVTEPRRSMRKRVAKRFYNESESQDTDHNSPSPGVEQLEIRNSGHSLWRKTLMKAYNISKKGNSELAAEDNSLESGTRRSKRGKKYSSEERRENSDREAEEVRRRVKKKKTHNKHSKRHRNHSRRHSKVDPLDVPDEANDGESPRKKRRKHKKETLADDDAHDDFESALAVAEPQLPDRPKRRGRAPKQQDQFHVVKTEAHVTNKSSEVVNLSTRLSRSSTRRKAAESIITDFLSLEPQSKRRGKRKIVQRLESPTPPSPMASAPEQKRGRPLRGSKIKETEVKTIIENRPPLRLRLRRGKSIVEETPIKLSDASLKNDANVVLYEKIVVCDEDSLEDPLVAQMALLEKESLLLHPIIQPFQLSNDPSQLKSSKVPQVMSTTANNGAVASIDHVVKPYLTSDQNDDTWVAEEVNQSAEHATLCDSLKENVIKKYSKTKVAAQFELSLRSEMRSNTLPGIGQGSDARDRSALPKMRKQAVTSLGKTAAEMPPKIIGQQTLDDLPTMDRKPKTVAEASLMLNTAQNKEIGKEADLALPAIEQVLAFETNEPIASKARVDDVAVQKERFPKVRGVGLSKKGRKMTRQKRELAVDACVEASGHSEPCSEMFDPLLVLAAEEVVEGPGADVTVATDTDLLCRLAKSENADEISQILNDTAVPEAPGDENNTVEAVVAEKAPEVEIGGVAEVRKIDTKEVAADAKVSKRTEASKPCNENGLNGEMLSKQKKKKKQKKKHKREKVKKSERVLWAPLKVKNGSNVDDDKKHLRVSLHKLPQVTQSRQSMKKFKYVEKKVQAENKKTGLKLSPKSDLGEKRKSVDERSKNFDKISPRKSHTSRRSEVPLSDKPDTKKYSKRTEASDVLPDAKKYTKRREVSDELPESRKHQKRSEDSDELVKKHKVELIDVSTPKKRKDKVKSKDRESLKVYREPALETSPVPSAEKLTDRPGRLTTTTTPLEGLKSVEPRTSKLESPINGPIVLKLVRVESGACKPSRLVAAPATPTTPQPSKDTKGVARIVQCVDMFSGLAKPQVRKEKKEAKPAARRPLVVPSLFAPDPPRPALKPRTSRPSS